MDAIDDAKTLAAADCYAANDRGYEDVLAEWLYWSLAAIQSGWDSAKENARIYRDAFLAGASYTRY